MTEDQLIALFADNILWILVTIVVLLVVFRGLKIVPQSEQYVIERFGRLHKVLGPGINLIVPFLDVVAHRISIRQPATRCGSNSTPNAPAARR